jgi:hypothetical protein
MTNDEGMTKAEYVMTGLRCSRLFEFRHSDLIRHSPFGLRHLRKIEACTESETLN